MFFVTVRSSFSQITERKRNKNDEQRTPQIERKQNYGRDKPHRKRSRRLLHFQRKNSTLSSVCVFRASTTPAIILGGTWRPTQQVEIIVVVGNGWLDSKQRLRRDSKTGSVVLDGFGRDRDFL